MSRDDDALRWEGDDELDLAAADAADADGAAVPRASAPLARERRSRGALGWLTLALAVAATAGWIVVMVANPVQQPSLLGLAMYQLGEVLAVIGPLLWWWCVDRLAPRHRRAPWWLAGLVVTAPWPLVAGALA
ncbi:hypothetical protein [Agrococcus sp. HG114]|uniref:hypothetical protein n=1 Tax=Agrococcus sp. HG114 TaxID=2969757 RepID=UPI00215AC140|nr:hypothetical protein [Agrococcus sp. HG114]MCR8671989.1 hypothetical protein [Agrococcus sp. HG114]